MGTLTDLKLSNTAIFIRSRNNDVHSIPNSVKDRRLLSKIPGHMRVNLKINGSDKGLGDKYI